MSLVTSSDARPGVALVRLALPLFFMGILDYAAGLVGLAWVGRLVGTHGLAVMSIWHPVSLIVLWAILVVPQGAGSLIALRIGRSTKSRKPMASLSALTTPFQVFASAMSLQMIITVLMACGLLIALAPLTRMLVGVGDLTSDLYSYGFWYVLSIPVWGGVSVMLSAIFATGNTRAGFIRSLVGLVFLSAAVPICVVIFGLGVIGPVVANLAFAVLLVFLLGSMLRKSDVGSGSYREGFQDKSIWLSILSIGGPSQMARIVSFFVLGVYVKLAIGEGVVEAAAFGLMTRLGTLAAKLGLALARASAIATGQNMGAGQVDRAVTFARTGMLVALGVGASFFAVCWLAEPVLYLFTSSDEVVDTTMSALSTYRWGFLVAPSVMVLVALFEAVGKTGKAALLFITADLLALSIALLLDVDGLTAAVWGLLMSSTFRLLFLAVLVPSRLLAPIRRASEA